MNAFIARYATPLTTGLFAVSAISGIALFFHVGQGTFHEMHEWLSMLLLLPFALHLWKNWRALMGYVQRRTLLIPVLLCVAAAVPFVLEGAEGGKGGGSPPMRAVRLLTQAPINDLAPLLHVSPEVLVDSLQKRGFEGASADQSLDSVAAAGGKSGTELLFGLLPGPAASQAR